MSYPREWFFGDRDQTTWIEMDSKWPEVQTDLNPNTDVKNVTCENEKKGSEPIKPEGVLYSSQQYADMKGDPSMSHEYATERVAAGHPSSIFPYIPNNMEATPTSRRHYPVTGDMFDLEMDNYGTLPSKAGLMESKQDSAPLNESSINNAEEYPVNIDSTRSVTITMVASKDLDVEKPDISPTGGGVQESVYPDTGQGFGEEVFKTGKRHFEGGNTSQQLW